MVKRAIVLTAWAAFVVACSVDAASSFHGFHGFHGKIVPSSRADGGLDGGTPLQTTGAPILGDTVSQADPPPPIFGGTLLVTGDDRFAVAADPDRDLIHLVDLTSSKLTASITTGAHSLPFRIVEGTSDIVFVTLRGAGALTAIDVASARAKWTADVCTEPRGLDFDSSNGHVLVACETGDVVTVDGATGETLDRVAVGVTGLRDVFVEPDGFWVSDFRSARVIHVAAGTVVDSLKTDDYFVKSNQGDFAWRTRRLGPNRFLLSHQLAQTGNLKVEGAGYGGPCGSSVESMLSVIAIGQMFPTTTSLVASSLPVDVAVRDDGKEYLVALPGNATSPVLPQFAFVAAGAPSALDCEPVAEGTPVPPSPARLDAQIVAAAYTHAGIGIIQSREPARLYVLDRNAPHAVKTTIELSAISRRDTGHLLFHANTGHAIACASCHAEGGDDGRTWILRKPMQAIPRRTPSLRGTLAGTAPYHWNGEEPSLDALFTDVMRERMRGPVLDAAQSEAFARWLERLPPPMRTPPSDVSAATRGQELFLGAGKCTNCHGASGIPSEGSFDIGKDDPMQAPSLTGVRFRAPYMHDGCASALEQRFEPQCGGYAHGGALSGPQIADVLVYLKTL
ncbi:hypothetical protein BH09MYX1_BH09MYX1_64860 [soil metagenome]